MALPTASDNPFSSLLITEGSAPSSPAAGKRRLYVLSSDHLAYLKDSSGTVVALTVGGYVPGGTDVPIADGGTGASTKAAAFDALSPMTTAGDVIIGGTAGTGTRLAAGTSTHVLTSNGAGAAPSWQAGGGGGGSTPTLLLDFVLASNIGPITLTAATWVEIIANQTFTKAAAGSLIEISLRGLGINNAGAGNYVATRIQIDSAGTPVNVQLGGIFRISTNENIFEGMSPVYISGLSAAAHTVKVQAFANGGDTFFCRPVSTAPEFFGMQVIEHL